MNVARWPSGVSPFCVGMVRSADTVLAAYEAGINFFFLSGDMHWPNYESTRQGISTLIQRGLRDRIRVAVATYVTQPIFCRAAFVEVVEAMPGLERVDLLVAGGAYRDEIGRRLDAIRETRDRLFPDAAVGASFHQRDAALRAINEGEVEIAFIRYNPGHPGAATDLFPHISRPDIPVFNFTNTIDYRPPAAYPLPEEIWRPERADYYRFALARPEIHGLLIAPGIPEHLLALEQALEAGPLEADEEEHMRLLGELTRKGS